MKQIKTIENSLASSFDFEVNQALSEGWNLVRRYINGEYFIAELEQEIITEEERCCDNCRYNHTRGDREPCASCNENADKWESP